MKDINKDLLQDENILKSYQAKYFLIGFIIGIVPYILLIILSENTHTVANLMHFKELLMMIGICTAIINAFVLRSKVNKKCVEILKINKGAKNLS